jgi:tRNA/rRNA methyltransferase
MQWSRDAAQAIVAHSQHCRVAMVFGNETFGLSNEELALCQMPVMIPANPEYASLNLAAAVQLMCYELRMAAIEPGEAPFLSGGLATVDEVESLHGHMLRAMSASGFYDPANPKRLEARLRRLFGRVRLERDEVNILRGMLSFFERPYQSRPAGVPAQDEDR